MHEVIEELENEGKLVLLCGVNLAVSALISKSEWFVKMLSDGKVFSSYVDALQSLESDSDPEGAAGGTGAEDDDQKKRTARRVMNVSSF